MRGFIVVLDSFGVGAAPDATAFGDEGASTIKTISKSVYFNTPNMKKWGFLLLTELGLTVQKSTTHHTAGLENFQSAKTPQQVIGKWQV